MLLKVAVEKNTSTGDITWHNLYANSIRLRLRKDYNLYDVPDKEAARKNLGVTEAVRVAKQEAIEHCESYTDDEILWLDDRLSLQVKFNLQNIKQIRKEFGLWVLKNQDNVDQWNDVTYKSIDLSTDDGVRAQGFTEVSLHKQDFARELNARAKDSELTVNNIRNRFWFDANKKPVGYSDDSNFVDYVSYALENAKTYIDDKNQDQEDRWDARYAELKEFIEKEIDTLTNWMVARFSDWQYAFGYTLKSEHEKINAVLETLTTAYNARFVNIEQDIDNINTDMHALNTATKNSDDSIKNSIEAALKTVNGLLLGLHNTCYNYTQTFCYNLISWINTSIFPETQRLARFIEDENREFARFAGRLLLGNRINFIPAGCRQVSYFPLIGSGHRTRIQCYRVNWRATDKSIWIA